MSDSPTIRRFVRSAWMLVAFQFVAALGAGGVTIWAASEVRALLNQRDLLLSRVHELEARPAAPPVEAAAPEPEPAPAPVVAPAPEVVETPPPAVVRTPPPPRATPTRPPPRPTPIVHQPPDEVFTPPPPPPPAPEPVLEDPIRPVPQEPPRTRRPRIRIPLETILNGIRIGTERPTRTPNGGTPNNGAPPATNATPPRTIPQAQPTLDPRLRRRTPPVTSTTTTTQPPR